MHRETWENLIYMQGISQLLPVELKEEHSHEMFRVAKSVKSNRVVFQKHFYVTDTCRASVTKLHWFLLKLYTHSCMTMKIILWFSAVADNVFCQTNHLPFHPSHFHLKQLRPKHVFLVSDPFEWALTKVHRISWIPSRLPLNLASKYCLSGGTGHCQSPLASTWTQRGNGSSPV